MKLRIANVGFETKAAAIERIRSILYRSHLCQPLLDEAHHFIYALLSCHPNAEEKIGVGVKHFEVRPSRWQGRCFWVVRRDGSETDFSFMECLKPASPKRNVLDALRTAIKDQVFAFKDEAFLKKDTVRCAVTGEPVSRHACHVDHEPPKTFEALAEEFLGSEGLDYLALAVGGYGDGEQEKRLLDPQLASRWAEFHRQHARLRITTKRANLSIVRKQGKEPCQL